MHVLATNRLNIRQLSLDDAPFILKLVNSPGWLKFIGDRQIRDLPAAEAYIRNGPIASYTNHGFGLYLLELKDAGIPIGIAGILKRDTLDHPDIGIALLPEYTGKGYALEAATAILAYAREHLGLPQVAAITVAENHRSINLLQKIGLVFNKKLAAGSDGKELLLFLLPV